MSILGPDGNSNAGSSYTGPSHSPSVKEDSMQGLFIFGPIREGMTKNEVLKAAEEAGASKSVQKQLKKAMKSDTDRIVTNNVEASMLNSIINPEQNVPTAPKSMFIKPRLKNDGRGALEFTGSYKNPDGAFVETYYSQDGKLTSSYLNFGNKNGEYYVLRDEDGDGKPDSYVEIAPGKEGRLHGETTRHIDLNN